MQKTLHYVWLGRGAKGANFQACLDSWKKFCPDYKIVEWNEDNFNFSNCKYAQQAYAQKKYAFVSDYIRLCVLYEYGGVYVDTDVEFVKNIDEFLDNQTTIGFENAGYLESNIIMCQKHQPWIKQILEYYNSANFVESNGKLNILPNTFLITAFLHKYYGLKICDKNQVLSGDIHVFSSDYFSPKDLQTQKITATQNTHSIHHFDASWTDKKFNTQQKFLRFARKVCGKKMFSCFTKAYSKSAVKKICKKI